MIPSFVVEFAIHSYIGISLGVSKFLNPPSEISKRIDTAAFREIVFGIDDITE